MIFLVNLPLHISVCTFVFRSGDDLFFWVQDEYWFKWFDEVYPPSLATPDIHRGSVFYCSIFLLYFLYLL